jgi:hypothetical protein
MLWVLNVGESVEGEIEGLVGLGESGRAAWQQSEYAVLRPCFDGWNDSCSKGIKWYGCYGRRSAFRRSIGVAFGLGDACVKLES